MYESLLYKWLKIVFINCKKKVRLKFWFGWNTAVILLFDRWEHFINVIWQLSYFGSEQELDCINFGCFLPSSNMIQIDSWTKGFISIIKVLLYLLEVEANADKTDSFAQPGLQIPMYNSVTIFFSFYQSQ